MFTNGLQAGLPQQVLDQSNLTNLGHSRICQVTGIAFIRGGPPTSVLTQTGYSRLSLCYYVLLFPRIFTFVDHAKLCVCVGVHPVSGRTHIIFVGTLLCCIWAGWFHSHLVGQRPVFFPIQTSLFLVKHHVWYYSHYILCSCLFFIAS